MLPNIIILTGGISGSSVLAGLIAKEGFWLGTDTKKVAYDTYENTSLVELNIQLFQSSDFHWRDIADIPPPSPQRIAMLYKTIDSENYRKFVTESDKHNPWLWKDPRLSYTIHFWQNLIDLHKCKFIVMLRDLRQTWTGLILRGKFSIPFDKLKLIHEASETSARTFLGINNIDYLSLTFEDLVITPNRTIDRLNCHLGTKLSISELEDVYKGKLGKARWSSLDYYKARLRFFYYKYFLNSIVTFPRKL